MKNIAKTFAISIAVLILKIFQGRLIQSAKIEALRLYIEAVGIARWLGMLWIVTASSIILIAFGFALLHMGIIFLLYLAGLKWSIGWIIVALGLIYMVAGLCLMRELCSEKNWLKYSNISELLAKLSETK